MQRDVERLLTVSEAINKYQLTQWAVYENIKTEPTFPVINLGPRKNYRLYEGGLKNWLNRHPAKKRRDATFVPTADDILEELGL
jgi:hypothetical protein